MDFKSQSFTVSDLYNWYRSGELFLQPKFQRRKVWKPIARSYLIDTVIRGLPMPKIYYRMQIDPTSVKSVREVVDGQQRLDAIFGYIEDCFAVSRVHKGVAAGKRYSKLSETVRGQILAYDISADLLIGATDVQVLQIFARINSYSVILNAQEKRNAKYFGRFKDFVYELGTDHLAFWLGAGILTNHGVARMAEAELASELVVALMAGLQDKKASLNGYYDNYNENFPQSRDIKRSFETVIVWIQENASKAIENTVFQRRALFYSLFMAVADAMFGIEGGRGPLEKFPKKLKSAQQEKLAERLLWITEGVRAKEPPPGLAKFAVAAARQTDNIAPRMTRHQLLFGILKGL